MKAWIKNCLPKTVIDLSSLWVRETIMYTTIEVLPTVQANQLGILVLVDYKKK